MVLKQLKDIKSEIDKLNSIKNKCEINYKLMNKHNNNLVSIFNNEIQKIKNMINNINCNTDVDCYLPMQRAHNSFYCDKIIMKNIMLSNYLAFYIWFWFFG